MDEFDYGTNRTRTVWVVCPWIRKLAIFDFVYTLASANIDQSVPNLATIYMPIRSWMSSIMGQIEPEHLELFAVEFGKVAEYDFVYCLSSTNINQSAPNLVHMYMTIRSWMNSIMVLIGPELSELSALELENLPYLTLFTLLTSANIDQSVRNLATIYMPIRSWMSAIMEQMNKNIRSYFPLNLEKMLNMTFFTVYHLQILTKQRQTWSKCMWSSNRTRIVRVICPWIRKFAIFDFVYILASTDINQSAPNLVKMYVTIRSWMRLIMDLIGAELSYFPLNLQKLLAESDFVYTIASTNVDQLVPNMVTVYMTMSLIIVKYRTKTNRLLLFFKLFIWSPSV